LIVKVRKQLATRVDQEAGLLRAIARFGAFAVCAGLFAAAASAAAEFDNRQVAQGGAIYLGVLPATVARDQPPMVSGGEPHQGTPEWGAQYHVVVALFDDGSGRRITDADVRATVFDARRPGNRLSGPQKQLEPMLVAGRASYGNYFNMPAPAPYRIELEIRRPGKSEITKASFEYRHAIVTTRPRP
jgi:hypothetical protein